MDENARQQFVDKYSYYTDKKLKTDGLMNKLGNLEYRTASTVLGGAGQSASGALNALSTVGDMAGKTISNVAGDNKVSDAINKIVTTGQNKADKMQAMSQYDVGQASKGLGTIGQGLVQAGVAGTQMVGDALLNSAVPGASLFGLGTRSFGSAAQEARQAGANLNQQLAYGGSNAAVEVISEKIFGGLAGLYGGGFADKLGEKVVSKIAKNASGKVAINILKNMGEEAAEEFIAGVIEPGLKSIYNNKKVFDNYDDDTKAEIIQSMIIGGLLGGFGGAVESIQTNKGNKFQAVLNAEEQARIDAENQAKAQREAEIQAEKEAQNQRIFAEQEAIKQQQAQAERDQTLYNAQTEYDANKGQVEDDLKFYEELKRNQNSKAFGVRAVFTPSGQMEYEIYRKKRVLSPEGREYDAVATPQERTKYTTMEDAQTAANELNDNYYKQLYDNSPIDITQNQVKRAMGKEFYNRPTEESMFGKQTAQNNQSKQTKQSANAQSQQHQQQYAPPKQEQTSQQQQQNQQSYQNTNNQDNFNAGQQTKETNQKFSTPNPEETGEAKYTRQGAETARDSNVTPEDFKPLIDNEIQKGDFKFARISNSSIVDKAQRTIINKGWDGALRDWQRAVDTGRTTAVDEAIGALLYNNAVNSGNTELALDILADYGLSGTNQARALQIRSIMNKLNPSNSLYLLEKAAFKYGKSMGVNEDIEISDNLKTEYLNAKTDAEKDAVLDKMAQEIIQKVPVKFMDKFKELRFLNMLGNFKTQARNVVGNSTSIGVWSLNNITKSIVQNTAKALGIEVENTSALNPGKERIQAAKDFFDSNKEVQKASMGSGKYDINEANAGLNDILKDKVSDARKKAIFRNKDGSQNFIQKAVEKYDTLTGWAMEKGDIVFSRGTFSRALAGYMKANNITAEQWTSESWQNSHKDLVDKALNYSIKQAQEVTFRDSNAFSDWMSKLARDPKTPKGVRLALEGLIPFRRTPANVLVRAEEYSPLGLINTAVKYAQMQKGNTDITGSDIVTQLSKSLTGSMILALGAYLRKRGVLRGREDEDKRKSAFEDQQGYQDYSIIIGDKTYTLDWLSPASIPLFMGVAWQDATKDGFEFSDLLKVLNTATDPMIEMSMLSSVNDLIEQLKYGETGTTGQILGTLAFSYATQLLTNTLIGQLERTSEKNRMSTYVDPNSNLPSWMQRQIGKASAKTPFWDYNQYEYIDMWGNTESNGDVMQRAIENMASPGYSSTIETNRIEKELEKVANKTGSSTVYPGSYDKTFDVKTYDKDGNVTSTEKKKLNKNEYVKYAKKVGQARATALNQLISSAEYSRLDAETKAKCIENIYEYATYEGKKAVSSYTAPSSSWLKKADTAVANGISISDYIIMKTLVDTDDNNSVSQKEAKAYLDSSNFTNSQKAVLYDNFNSSWKTNPYSGTTKQSTSSSSNKTQAQKDMELWLKKLK